MGNSGIKMRETFIRYEKETEKIGLQINENKTKCVHKPKGPEQRWNITIEDYNFKRVKEFKYLGATITEDTIGVVTPRSKVKKLPVEAFPGFH